MYVYSRVSTSCPATGTDNSKPLIPVYLRKTRPSSNYEQLMSLQLTPLSSTLILYLSFLFIFLSDHLPRDLPPPQLFIVCCDKIKLAPQKKHVELRDLFKIFVTLDTFWLRAIKLYKPSRNISVAEFRNCLFNTFVSTLRI
jgi:hypothetical protein